MTRRGRRRLRRRLPRFAMTDHDEMTGCSAWADHEQRTLLSAVVGQLHGLNLGGQLNLLQREPQTPLLQPLLAAVCDRCGLRGISTTANYCPRCGAGGSGWAQLDRSAFRIRF